MTPGTSAPFVSISANRTHETTRVRQHGVMTSPPGETETTPTAAEVKRFLSGLFDRVAATYESVGVPFFGPLGRRLVLVAALQPGWRVLDVGCGRGAALIPAAEAVGPTGEVIGIDLAPGMVEATAVLAERRGLHNVRVLQMDAESPDPALGPFDAVLAGFVVFLLPDPLGALRRYLGMLRPGGRFAMSSWAAEDARWRVLHAVYEQFQPPPPTGEPGTHLFEDVLRRWQDTNWVEALLTDAGFAGVHSENHVHRSRFRDADHYLEWDWAHAGRAAWERLPVERHDEVRAALRIALGPLAESDGSLILQSSARYTVARRPGPVS
jgi:ubiquinone/menaquinone biosynthesis C-methylase UbiE